jgi:tRNA(Ser,Leu) C12 N-acetylase TAN1
MNVVLMCERDRERFVLEEVKEYGKFESSGFRDVLIGEVDDVEKLLASLSEKPFIPVTRAIPMDQMTRFAPDKFIDMLKERVKRYVTEIGPEETFCVRMERRGMKGIISSRDVEKEVGSYLWTLLKERHGKEPRVDLKDPDKLISVQTFGNLCGISLISKELRQKYPFVRAK